VCYSLVVPAYRSDQEALEHRVTELQEDLAHALREEQRLLAERARLEADASRLEVRLLEAGPGAGERGAARDRVGVAAVALGLVGVPLLLVHAEWHRYVSRGSDVLPAILLLGAPGALAALIAWPYRQHSLSCQIGLALGAAFAVLAVAHASMGWWPQ
jgi:hypothetical protein